MLHSIQIRPGKTTNIQDLRKKIQELALSLVENRDTPDGVLRVLFKGMPEQSLAIIRQLTPFGCTVGEHPLEP